MKKILFLTLISFYLLLPYSVKADDSDSFNSGYSSWTNSQIQTEGHTCGNSGCNAIKLSNTTSGGGGYLTKTFSVTQGARYRISIKAGVYTGGTGTGEVWLMVISGSNNQSIYCNQDNCTAGGSSINGSLTISDFEAKANWLTVKIEGVQEGCTTPSGGTGGRYTNLCGTGTSASHIAAPCTNDCNTSTQSCYGGNVYKWVCNGNLTNCISGGDNVADSQTVSDISCGKTVQLDAFTEFCRDGNDNWVCNDAIPDSLKSYIVYYTGDCPVAQSCRDPYADDFTFTKIADAPTPPPPTTTTTNASTCSSISINNGNPIIAGQTYSATVNMINDGNTTWSSSSNYSLGSQEPQDQTTWGTSSGTDSGKGTRPSRASSSSGNTGPGGTATFTFNVTAPNTAGTYRFSYQMVQDGPAGWFGSRCTPNINVSAPVLATNPSVTCDPNKTTALILEDVVWTAIPRGGSGSGYRFTWTGTDNLNGKATNPVTVNYATVGSKSGSVKVTDSAGNSSPDVTCYNSVTISEPFNYTISNTGDIRVIQGSSGSTTININKTAGNFQTVNLSSNPTLPAGATKTMTPASCAPNTACNSSYTIYTTETTPVGAYSITVNSTSPGVTNKSTDFSLVVRAPVTGGTPPTVNIRANNVEGPIDIAHNAAATLSWVTANNPTSCTGTGSWSGAKSFTSGTNHTQSTGNLTGPNSYTYTIGCENPAGSYSDSVVVNVAAPVGTPACSLSASPASGTGPFSSTIRVNYVNLASSPGTITINCGSGSNATASSCTGTSGSCSATCSYPGVSASTTYNATASIGSVLCSPATVANNAPGATPAPSSCPWIQTTGGDVHSNTKITARCGP